MKYFTLAFQVLMVGLFGNQIFAQTGAISGTVLDDDNKIIKEFTVRLSTSNKAEIDLEKGSFFYKLCFIYK